MYPRPMLCNRTNKCDTTCSSSQNVFRGDLLWIAVSTFCSSTPQRRQHQRSFQWRSTQVDSHNRKNIFFFLLAPCNSYKSYRNFRGLSAGTCIEVHIAYQTTASYAARYCIYVAQLPQCMHRQHSNKKTTLNSTLTATLGCTFDTQFESQSPVRTESRHCDPKTLQNTFK